MTQYIFVFFKKLFFKAVVGNNNAIFSRSTADKSKKISYIGPYIPDFYDKKGNGYLF